MTHLDHWWRHNCGNFRLVFNGWRKWSLKRSESQRAKKKLKVPWNEQRLGFIVFRNFHFETFQNLEIGSRCHNWGAWETTERLEIEGFFDVLSFQFFTSFSGKRAYQEGKRTTIECGHNWPRGMEVILALHVIHKPPNGSMGRHGGVKNKNHAPRLCFLTLLVRSDKS